VHASEKACDIKNGGQERHLQGEREGIQTRCYRWRRVDKSKCFEADLKALVDEGLLQSQEIIQWHPTTRDKRPYEEADEIVLFHHFVERGLVLLTSDSLLFHCGVQLHHHNPNSILQIAIFVHFCEAFLGI
jgi:hypothetical protein